MNECQLYKAGTEDRCHMILFTFMVESGLQTLFQVESRLVVARCQNGKGNEEKMIKFYKVSSGRIRFGNLFFNMDTKVNNNVMCT